MMRVIFDWRFRPKNPRKLSALTFKTIPGILIMQGTCSWAWKDLIALENLGIITVNRCHGRSHQSKQSKWADCGGNALGSERVSRTNQPVVTRTPSSGHSRQRLKCAFFLQSFLQIFHSLKGSAACSFFTREVVRLFFILVALDSSFIRPIIGNAAIWEIACKSRKIVQKVLCDININIILEENYLQMHHL